MQGVFWVLISSPAGTLPRTWLVPGLVPSPTALDWRQVFFHFEHPRMLHQVSPVFLSGTSDKIHLLEETVFYLSATEAPSLPPWQNNVIESKGNPYRALNNGVNLSDLCI